MRPNDPYPWWAWLYPIVYAGIVTVDTLTPHAPEGKLVTLLMGAVLTFVIQIGVRSTNAPE